jgi:hypothetical protein
MGWRLRDGLLAAWIALACASAILAVRQAGGLGVSGSERPGVGRGVSRDVPMDELLRRIETRRLSDHPAAWAVPVAGDEGERGRLRRDLPERERTE